MKLALLFATIVLVLTGLVTGVGATPIRACTDVRKQVPAGSGYGMPVV